MDSKELGDFRSEEYKYLDLLQDIINNGRPKRDRTGTGTIYKFGAQMSFDLSEGKIPLLTTKKVFWRGIVEELLWFISGSTNSNILKEKNIHFWDANGSKDFLSNLGLGHRDEGDLGPVYGFQWRHFGATYVDMHTDYAGKGFDQLADVIDRIKNKPDRRLIMTAWNPPDLPLMALPPCHCFVQFDVSDEGELSCHLFQRSADMGLGVPFNIASYALLTHMIAHVTNLIPGRFVHTLSDAHVYKDHIEPLKEQLKRTPGNFPKIKFTREVKHIDDFKYEDIELVGYQPHGSILMKMSV